MSLDLDDTWFDENPRLSRFSLIERRRLYRVAIVFAGGLSYLLDTLLLLLFELAGTIEWISVVVYGGAALGHIALFSLLHWSGVSERFANPHLPAPQMLYALAVQVIGIILAPALAPFFLGLIFIVFAFGTLRCSLTQALAVWFATVVTIAIAMSAISLPNFGIMSPSQTEVILVWASFSLILLRTIALGYYASTLRMKIFKKGLQLEDAATRDTLTGIYNRGAILSAISEQISLNQRKGLASCIALIDLDNFKAINDTMGHVVGDMTLKTFSTYIKGHIRETDKFGRYGGEEFIVLLPVTQIDDALRLLDRMRVGVREIEWEKINPGIHITFSCGITEIRSSDRVQSAIHRADTALYRAKANGKNRVCTEH